MPRRSRPLGRRAAFTVGFAAALASLLACSHCRAPSPGPIEKAFRLLPPDQAILLYADVAKTGPSIVERLWETADWSRDLDPEGQGMPVFGKAALPPLRDIDALAFAADESRRTLWVSGRFTEESLRSRLSEVGIECREALTAVALRSARARLRQPGADPTALNAPAAQPAAVGASLGRRRSPTRRPRPRSRGPSFTSPARACGGPRRVGP